MQAIASGKVEEPRIDDSAAISQGAEPKMRQSTSVEWLVQRVHKINIPSSVPAFELIYIPFERLYCFGNISIFHFYKIVYLLNGRLMQNWEGLCKLLIALQKLAQMHVMDCWHH